MSIVIMLPLLVCLAGLVWWAVSDKFKPIALYMFGCGLLVTLFSVATKIIKF